MNNKMTFNELKDALAAQSGYSREKCENFLKNLFSEITLGLVSDGTVKVKGLGTFKLIDIEPRKSVNINTGEQYEIPGHKRVSFTPDKNLAARINRSFEAFTAVEIPDSVDEADLERLDAEEIVTEQPAEEPAAIPAEEAVLPTEEPTEEPVAEAPTVREDLGNSEHFAEEEILEEETEEEVLEEEEANESEPEEEEPDESAEVYVEDTVENPIEAAHEVPSARSRSFSFLWGFIAGFIACALICTLAVGILLGWSGLVPESADNKPEPPAVVEAPLPENDTLQAEPAVEAQGVQAEPAPDVVENKPATQPSDPAPAKQAPVYDTITKTRYLTTMAREHYGSYHLWPYIYEENKAILGHPDRIRPGTRVVIPDLKKYGVDPKSKADIEAAKKKGVAIYARYKNVN